MKKRNKKIGKQILIGILSVAFLTVVMLAVISVMGLKRVQKEIVTSDFEVIAAMADDEVVTVMNDIQDEMMGVCENLSLNCSEKMKKYMEELKICTDIITDIYEHPDNYGSSEIQFPSESTRDKLCLYYSLNKELDYDSKKDEISKIACSQKVFRSIYESSLLNSIYYTTKDGILFSFDSNSGEVLDKLEEGQTAMYLWGYEPRETEWYKNSCNDEKGSISFSSTYLDSTGNLVVTCSQPVYKNDEYMGVMAIDIYLGNLEEELIGTDDIKYDGFVEIADSNGNVIVSPNLTGDEEQYKHINILTDEEEGLTDIAENMLSGAKDTEAFLYNEQQSRVVYMPVEYTGWSIAVIFNTDMFMQNILDRYDYIMEANSTTEKNVAEIIENIMVFFLAGAIIIMIFGALLAKPVSSRITKPIEALIKDVNVISGGNLDYSVYINTGNELEELGEAFNKMTSSLKEYMANLKKATADKERISTELNVASQIQLSLLPGQSYEPYGKDFFEICAFMKPAKEVGGDFYDYFMTDDNHIWLVAADVSGKGIPASLFMMMGKTLIKNMAKTIGTPAEILKEANRQLNEHNDAMMFITCLVCVVELSTGRMTFANAGHNYPLYHTAGRICKKLENTPDLPLAIMDDTEYQNHYVDLREGDRLFLYTDGVTEAMDEDGGLYGEERLCNVFGRSSEEDKKGEEILQDIREDMKKFSGEAEQADDITMMVFRFIRRKEGAEPVSGSEGENVENNLVVRADLRELSRVIEFVDRKLSVGGFNTEFVTTIKFMADEMFSNIAQYAYDDGEGEAVVTVNVFEGEGAEIIFEDRGKKYNPLEQKEPDVLLSGEEREEGGLGIYLVRSMADEMGYEYSEGRNIVRIRKNVKH